MRMLHWNTTDQCQWIQEKWDLTSQMIWYSGMLHYPIWLIEVEEDLFLISFIQLYQSTRMMMLHHVLYHNCLRSHRNTTDQTQWIQEKWDLTLKMIWYSRMHNHPVWLIGVEEDLFLTSFIQQYQSTRMMMPNWNTPYQTQWIEEKWDLTLQMIWYSRMRHYPVWLIEVEENLLFISFIQQYQSTRMMMPLHCYSNHRNTTYQTQWIEEKWDLTL